MSQTSPPLQVVFDPTPEIFATDSGGGFGFPLFNGGERFLDTEKFDEARFVVSLWHPASGRSIDLDRAYVEMQGAFDMEEEHWVKLAEVEPVVPPYDAGETFDGWIVLPVFARRSRFQLVGGGFHPRARLQIRTSVYLVA